MAKKDDDKKERASSLAYTYRKRYGIFKDLPKALPLDKNLSRGELKSKLGSSKPR